MTGFLEWSATAYCLFMATIVSTRTMTSLRLRAKFKPYIYIFFKPYILKICNLIESNFQEKAIHV